MEKNFSFRKGWNQLKVSDAPVVRSMIMDALGLTFRTSFYYRLNGKCEPTMTEARAIEGIFSQFGIKDIWGNE